jgi:glucose-6-phosphate 1-dehydrogenase
MQPDTLVIRIQPDEGITLRIVSKVPGPVLRLQTVRMDFDYGRSFGAPSPEAYERLLLDAVSGEASLFARDDEVDQAWQIITPLLEEWAARGREGLCSYQAGTWGPLEAADLPARDGRRWRRL